ncbi:MAG: shikimate dehydrogenase [Bacteroidia bacterium]
MKKRYGLIGKKLGHTFSPGYFSDKFAREKIAAEYHAHELTSIDMLGPLIQDTPSLKGLNVTMPYKKAVIPLLDFVEDAASQIGAVNTIHIQQDGTRHGFNTDIIGFRKALLEAWGDRPIQQAVVLGTGGSAQAVLYVLSTILGIKRPIVVSRKPQKNQIGYPDLAMLQSGDFDIVVNTTPLGMSPDIYTAPDFPYHIFSEEHLAFDLVYNPLETSFLQQAAAYGARTENGIAMLHAQAEASWEIWQT